MIALTRVDERLVHGQIAFAWTNALEANCIFVVNDEVANDSLRKTSLKMAAPPSVKFVVKGVADAEAALAASAIDKYRVFLIVDNTSDALALAEKSEKIRHVNLGNLHATTERKEVTNSVYLSEDEFEDVRNLKKLGAEVECRAVPGDRKVDPLGGD
jgi:PTS system mannose-specific IIB component/fructoselysine and glucoselysine-specific PTS system IIB component